MNEDKEILRREYLQKNTQTKKKVRGDKRQYTDTLEEEAQELTNKGDSRTEYQVTKTLTRRFTSGTTIFQNKHGTSLRKEQLNK